MDGSFNYIEGLGIQLTGEKVCEHCGLDRLQHHYGVDGPRSGFIYKNERLYCPGNFATYSEKK